MLRDITLGKYYKTSSFVHSLDPRCKLIILFLMMILTFTLSGVWEYVTVTAMIFVSIALSKVPIGYILKGMKPVWVLVIFTFVINLVFGRGEDVLFEWWVIKVTEESLYMAMGMMARVIILVVLSTVLTLTTSPMALTGGLEKLLKPLEKVRFPSHEVSMMMSIALRFIPTLAEEADKILKAQKARGNDIEEGGFVRKMKGMIPLFVPLFVSAFKRADDLALAMETRCYNGGGNRTSFKVLEYTKKDMATFIFTGIVILIIIGLKIGL